MHEQTRRAQPGWPRGQTPRLPNLYMAAGEHDSPTRVPLSELHAGLASHECLKRCRMARSLGGCVCRASSTSRRPAKGKRAYSCPRLVYIRRMCISI